MYQILDIYMETYHFKIMKIRRELRISAFRRHGLSNCIFYYSNDLGSETQIFGIDQKDITEIGDFALKNQPKLS